MIAGRSRLAFKSGITSFNGTVDSDYTGELKVLLFYTSDCDYRVTKGDRVSQLTFHCIISPTVKLCEFFNHSTERGSCGFGSTGK